MLTLNSELRKKRHNDMTITSRGKKRNYVILCPVTQCLFVRMRFLQNKQVRLVLSNVEKHWDRLTKNYILIRYTYASETLRKEA